MAAEVRWNDEMEAFREWMKNLPEDVAEQADNLAYGEANAAALSIRTAYGQHRHTGNLQSHVVVDRPRKKTTIVSSKFGNWEVRSTSPLAYIFEFGTVARHYFTVNGIRHVTGRMPPAHIFITIAIQRRRVFVSRLKALFESRYGVKVIGDAA